MEIKKAKNEWLQEKAKLIEFEMLSGHSRSGVWSGLSKVRQV